MKSLNGILHQNNEATLGNMKKKIKFQGKLFNKEITITIDENLKPSPITGLVARDPNCRMKSSCFISTAILLPNNFCRNTNSYFFRSLAVN